MRVLWTFGRGLVALSAAILVLPGAGSASAQFVPFGNQNPAPYQPSQYQQPQYQQPQYQRQQTAYQGYAQPNQGYAQPKQGYAQPNQSYAQQPGGSYAQQPANPQYTAMAFQGSGSRDADLSLTPPAEPVAAGPTQADKVPQQTAPGQSYGGSTTPLYENYPPNTGAYNTFGGSGLSGNGYGGGLFQGAQPGYHRRWFGGVYGLLMERDNASRVPLAFTTTAPAVGVYPTDTETTLTTRNVDIDFQGGAEVRLGSTLGWGSYGGGGACSTCDSGSCGGSCNGGPRFGWEAAYWGIVQQSETAQVLDAATFATDGNRTYGMMDFRGLEYNPGTGYRSVDVYYDYGPPTADHSAPVDVEVRSFTARSTFSAQNVEVNLLRLPVLCNSCATAGGYGHTGQRYSVTTLAGFRFMRFDEDFMFRTDYEVQSAPVSTGFLAYNVQADNQLYGFQLGSNGVYHLGNQGRWALHFNSAFGLYGNHIRMKQRMDAPSGGTVRFANGTQQNFNVESNKDDFSLIGELRVGGSYQYSPYSHWRLYGGWRVVGVTGIALATDQIPTAFITPGQVGQIASNGSLILHGLQAGIEWNY